MSTLESGQWSTTDCNAKKTARIPIPILKMEVVSIVLGQVNDHRVRV